jgi:hypothetical protein
MSIRFSGCGPITYHGGQETYSLTVCPFEDCCIFCTEEETDFEYREVDQNYLAVPLALGE